MNINQENNIVYWIAQTALIFFLLLLLFRVRQYSE